MRNKRWSRTAPTNASADADAALRQEESVVVDVHLVSTVPLPCTSRQRAGVPKRLLQILTPHERAEAIRLARSIVEKRRRVERGVRLAAISVVDARRITVRPSPWSG